MGAIKNMLLSYWLWKRRLWKSATHKSHFFSDWSVSVNPPWKISYQSDPCFTMYQVHRIMCNMQWDQTYKKSQGWQIQFEMSDLISHKHCTRLCVHVGVVATVLVNGGHWLKWLKFRTFGKFVSHYLRNCEINYFGKSLQGDIFVSFWSPWKSFISTMELIV